MPNKQNHSQQPTIIEEEDRYKKNRPTNLKGFTILDEKWNDSSDDSDDSLPVGSYISSTNNSGVRFCKSVDFRPLKTTINPQSSTTPSTPTQRHPPNTPSNDHPMASGGSRFKIVPVETRYKRDRWQCYEFYDHRDPFFTRVPKAAPNTPTATLKKEEEQIINRSSRSLSDIHPIPATTIQQKNVRPPIPRPIYIAPKQTSTRISSSASNTITNGSNAQATAAAAIKASKQNNGGSATEILRGLEKSLSSSQPRRTKSVAASPPVHHALNIDSKIEQAMDLVKTHLMFAVREEVDGLRHKIFDLENHVHKLEAENAILKRTIPNDVLQKLHLKL